jgi:hypothetical protein
MKHLKTQKIAAIHPLSLKETVDHSGPRARRRICTCAMRLNCDGDGANTFEDAYKNFSILVQAGFEMEENRTSDPMCGIQ